MIGTYAIRLSIIILLLTCFRSTALVEEWKGIIPGVSTRADVVRLFQRCADRSASCEFDLENNKIRIVFSGMVQDYFYQCSKNLPVDTVLVVEVSPRVPITLKSLRQRHSLKKLGSMSNFSGYIDERAGLILKTYKENVIQLNYVAADSHRGPCEDYYKDPIRFIAVVTHCPPITLEGPTSVVTAGNVVNFKADVQPDPKMTLVWTVSDGKIVDQAGRHISLDTTGLGGKSVKVTVQGRGSCSVENSFTLNIQ